MNILLIITTFFLIINNYAQAGDSAYTLKSAIKLPYLGSLKYPELILCVELPLRLKQMPNLELIILVGLYAQKYYLKDKAKNSLTETVKNFEEYLPNYIVLPHPSQRNNIWQAKNPWFTTEVLPKLKKRIYNCL